MNSALSVVHALRRHGDHRCRTGTPRWPAMKQTIDASKAFADKYLAAAKPVKQ
jgi:hypothetical protein